MSISRPPKAAPRRRRSPASAEREILAAAEAFLRERPFRDLTVDEVMSRTTLSRPSFYVYFRDRHQLAVRLVEGIGGELFAMSDRWLQGSGDPLDDIRAALRGVAEVFERHGLVLHAIADAAGHDPEVEEVYYGLIRRFVTATEARIERDTKQGVVSGLEPLPTAGALVWMTERYMLQTLGRLPQEPYEDVADALWNVWVRTLYA